MTRKWCLALALAVALAPLAFSQNDMPVNKAVESTAQQLTRVLLQQGLQVARGYSKLWTIEECDYTIAKIGTCFGNNPAAPYVIAAVPAWPEEYVDTDSILFGPSRGHLIDVLRFDPREAIVILALMPPPSRYFSEQTYLWTRQGSFDKSSDTYQNICGLTPPDPFFQQYCGLFFMYDRNHAGRVFAFASLSNPINNVVMFNRDSKEPFSQLRYFIITPDQFMDSALRQSFSALGIDEQNDVFTEKIPSDMNVGLDYAADDFMIGIRYAQPLDGGGPGTRSYVWRKQLPLAVLRVRDMRTNRSPIKYPPVVLDTRTAVDESVYESDLQNLVTAVKQRWGQSGADAEHFRDLQSFPAYMVGPDCTPIGENCVGDNWDAAYQLYGPNSLDHGEIYAIAGTLGTKTGNATYVGLSINVMPVFKGVANLSDGDLEGTADTTWYASKGLGNLDNFFLYYFARDCSGLETLTDGNCLPLNALVPRGDSAGFGIRDYVRQGTERGPNSSEVLPAVMIQLHRP